MPYKPAARMCVVHECECHCGIRCSCAFTWCVSFKIHVKCTRARKTAIMPVGFERFQ